MEGIPSSEAGDRSHPQQLFPYLVEPPKLARGTGSPEAGAQRAEEREVLPGGGDTAPTPCLLSGGGGEEPLPSWGRLLPLGQAPLPPELGLSRAEGAFGLQEPQAEGPGRGPPSGPG